MSQHKLTVAEAVVGGEALCCWGREDNIEER